MPTTDPQWSRAALRRLDDRFAQLRRLDCQFCGALDSMRVQSQPGLISIGERGEDDRRRMYYVVYCRQCGNTLLFDAGAFYERRHPLLTYATDEEQLAP